MNLIADEALFYIEGIATQAISTNDAITLNDKSDLVSEAYDSDLKIMNIAIETRNKISSDVFAVSQNEPNPFGDVTSITYYLPEAGNVSISITDVAGKMIYTRSNDAPKGEGNFVIEASNLNQSGVYYYTVTSDEYSTTNKMILIK